jgi:hypothetical protein
MTFNKLIFLGVKFNREVGTELILIKFKRPNY